jgi:HSP20 family protein
MPANKTIVEAPAGEAAGPSRVDEAIVGVEQLYQALTGRPVPPPAEEPYAPIPVEKDAAEFVTERLDRLLDALGTPLGQPAPPGGAAVQGAPAAGWSPPVTVLEDSDGLLVLLDVPGVQREQLQLSDDGDSLTVAGQRLVASDGLRLRMSERPLGPFRRRIVLPRGSGGGEVKARLHDGVLEIRIPRPKGTATGPRTLTIS